MPLKIDKLTIASFDSQAGLVVTCPFVSDGNIQLCLHYLQGVRFASFLRRLLHTLIHPSLRIEENNLHSDMGCGVNEKLL